MKTIDLPNPILMPNGKPLQPWQWDVLRALLPTHESRDSGMCALTKRQVTRELRRTNRMDRYPNYKTKRWLTLKEAKLVDRTRQRDLEDKSWVPGMSQVQRDWRWWMTKQGKAFYDYVHLLLGGSISSRGVELKGDDAAHEIRDRWGWPRS